jgi:hypothetical protein
MPAYALFSDACLAAMAADPVALGMREHRESYEVIGEIGCWALDLEAAWQREEARMSFAVAPKDAILTLEAFMPGPPALVWDLLTSPAYRPRWNSGVDRVDESPACVPRPAQADAREPEGVGGHRRCGQPASTAAMAALAGPMFVLVRPATLTRPLPTT